jgi:Flp pilus assembly protein TadD
MTAPARAAGRIWRLAAGGIALGLVALAAAWFWWPPSPTPETGPEGVPDPRLTYSGPFLNVRPDVNYVGDAACADCHADLASSYSHHPMGRAMAPIAAATSIERFGPANHNPFEAGGFGYEVRRTGDQVTHREWASGPDGKPVAEVVAPVPFAVGSGAKVRSYLVERDGFLFQSPASWFSGPARWDLSPNYELRNRHFSRAVVPGCLFCHCTFADHVEGTVNRYRSPAIQGYSIGCERCHGPGAVHVQARGRGEHITGAADYSIVNPARLEHSLREAVCQQCHLQGEQRVVGRGRGEWDFRPGMPLDPFLTDFVDGRDERGGEKFVSSVEQMMASQCYRESREPRKLGCTSCHDPHHQPADEADKVTHYRARCLTCHTDQSCTLPVPTRQTKQPDDSCIACHMPTNGSEVSHSSITNHAIPRRSPPQRLAQSPSTPGPTDLVPFNRALVAAADPEVARNLGIARLGMRDRGGMPAAAARTYAAFALPLLDAAVIRDPSDWPAVEARAEALWLVGRPDEAWDALATVVAARPTFETSQYLTGALALDMGRAEEARDHLEQAVRINPYQVLYHHDLARVWLRLRRPDRAAAECRDALRLEPSRAPTRSLFILALLADSRREAAEAEFAILRALTPEAKRSDLEKWYREEKGRATRPGGP